MTNTLLYIFLLLFSCSCTKQLNRELSQDARPPVIETGGDSSYVQISFITAAVSMTKAANIENDIHDLNIYFYNATAKTVKHHYLSAGNNLMNMKIANGNYEIYSIANIGSDLGSLNIADIRNLKNSVTAPSQITQGDRLLMSDMQTVSVNRYTELRIQLKRLAAKITFNIVLMNGMETNSRIVSLKLCQCNNVVNFFTGNKAMVKWSYPVNDFSALNVKSINQSYYLFENLQGKNPIIQAHYQRTRENAPECATYLLIRVERERKIIDYRIYLGENITDDFNVTRNTNYSYTVKINGENLNDLRVSSTGIVIYSGWPSDGMGAYNRFNKLVWSNNIAYAELNVVANNIEPDNDFYLSYTKLSGTFFPNNLMTYKIQDVTPSLLLIKENTSLKFHTGNGKSVVYFAFVNSKSETIDNKFIFTIWDDSGISKSFTLQTSNTL